MGVPLSVDADDGFRDIAFPPEVNIQKVSISILLIRAVYTDRAMRFLY